MTLHELQRRLSRFDLLKLLSESANESKERIADYNREQLLLGLDSNENYLSPRYSEDPFFKSKESAQRYAQWKNKIEPKRDKPFDVPNLYITGRFHNSIEVEVGPTEIGLFSDDANSIGIEQKFTTDIYGLNNESKREYIPKHLLPILKNKITGKLGLKFG